MAYCKLPETSLETGVLINQEEIMCRIKRSKKWDRVKEMIRKILGRNLVNGKYRIAEGMKA